MIWLALAIGIGIGWGTRARLRPETTRADLLKMYEDELHAAFIAGGDADRTYDRIFHTSHRGELMWPNDNDQPRASA